MKEQVEFVHRDPNLHSTAATGRVDFSAGWMKRHFSSAKEHFGLEGFFELEISV